MTVWVNGTEVYSGDTGDIDIQLNQGKNAIAVRATQQTNLALYIGKPNF